MPTYTASVEARSTARKVRSQYAPPPPPEPPNFAAALVVLTLPEAPPPPAPMQITFTILGVKLVGLVQVLVSVVVKVWTSTTKLMLGKDTQSKELVAVAAST
jgi:hypothetical protein